MSKEKPRNLWKSFNFEYQEYVTIPSIGSTADEKSDKTIYMEDLEKRKEAYGICGECNEPGTGRKWCKPCNAKRFEKNFKNWTSGNKDIDELIQQSQLNAVHYKNCLEWISYENFKNVTHCGKGGFSEIYSAEWSKGYIYHWNIENQEWERLGKNIKVALKRLNYSNNPSDIIDIIINFLNEIKSLLQIYHIDVIQCYGITQDPDTKNYMMVFYYCKGGNLREHYKQDELDYGLEINRLYQIARGLLNIHNAGKVHKDFHSGNILCDDDNSYISDLGMCQPANNEEKSKKIYGVLPYMAPEVLRGCQYTKASDIYSFGIIMNELFSRVPFNDVSHDLNLAVNICKGHRPETSKDTPKLFADLIRKCWDAKAENRPTAKELHEILGKLYDEKGKYGKIIKNEYKNVPTHPEALYTSRLLSFENLPEPINTECFDCMIKDNLSECQS